MTNFFRKQNKGNVVLAVVGGVFVIAVLIVSLSYLVWRLALPLPSFPPISPPEPSFFTGDIKKFSSEEEFKDYLKKGTSQLGYLGIGGLAAEGMPGMARRDWALQAPEVFPSPLTEQKAVTPERVSETTVQVPGIDEPDIVKTDGKEIYFSSQRFWVTPLSRTLPEGISWEERQRIIPPPEPQARTNVVKAFPPQDLAIDAKIDKQGDLLLAGNILVIFSDQERKIYGYDVSNPAAPEKKWEIKLENNNQIVGARLYNNKVYLVTKNVIDQIRPCPIEPLKIGEIPLSIRCQDIYYPIVPVAVDVTFVAMILDPNLGTIEKNISFVGSSTDSIVYMSPKAIYVTYTYSESILKFFSNFLKEKGRDIIPVWVIERIEKLESYDISEQAKFMEFETIFEKFQSSLGDDEQMRIENELSNRLSDYYKEYKRDLEKTGIVKIGLDAFEVAATGSVPGIPLNNFSLDEYNDYLRIATTIGERWGWGFGISIGGGRESANDIYVLDRDLKILGSVKELGLTERIYSVRFIEDKGYVVTFRQTDPFYVLDLSEPQNPQLKGELKIPGYSSYLHPITKDKILGIGMEGWQVKISLFDVAQAENPKELAKYILDESWSEVLSNYHAFLLDKKHDIFFLPGGKGGYIFSYKNDKLELVKTVSEISVKRAIYINDYLYIIGDNKITVLSEIDWEKVNELEL